MTTTKLKIPNLTLRDYQLPGWRALEGGARRAAFIWPRRSGKDTISLQWMCYDAHRTIGNYWHLMPEAVQSRKAMWTGINKDGNKIIDQAFPKAMRAKTNDSEMFIELKCGSTIQFGGSDRYDALVGSNPRGVVFSEYPIGNPKAYDFVRPILAENHGWALFPYTPRGRNHGWDLFRRLTKDPGSFAQLLTCDDTKHMTVEALALEKAEMSEELYLQEYFGSFDFGLEGAFFAKQMSRAHKEGRICDVPYDEGLPVWVSWDLGLRDSTALWFFQCPPGGQLRFIDYYEANGQQLKHYVDLLDSKPYSYGSDLILPHDAGAERLGMADSIELQLRNLGKPGRILKVERSVLPGIEDCRVAINRAVFDTIKTEDGRAALTSYKREWDDKHMVFRPKPLHDWTADAADSFRYAVRAYNAGWCSSASWAPIDYSTLNRAAI